MSKKHWLLSAVAALSWFNAGVIWLIQFSCYPLWPYALLFFTSIGTAAWWAPLMARLVAPDGAMLLGDYQLLMSTHWIRVALISACGITYFYILIKSATTRQWNIG